MRPQPPRRRRPRRPFRYVLTFISGLDVVPALVQQASRLRDIGRRLRDRDPPAPAR